VSGETQAGGPTHHAAGKAAGHHETLLAALIIRANGGVKLPVLRVPVLVVIVTLIVATRGPLIRRTVMAVLRCL